MKVAGFRVNRHVLVGRNYVANIELHEGEELTLENCNIPSQCNFIPILK